MIVLSAAVAAIAAVLLLPTLSDLVSAVWVLGRGVESGQVAADAELPSIVFLVPAHDEERGIGPCLRSLMGVDYPVNRRRVVVVADNCTDGTAEVSRAAGAECFERHDLDRPGKPWALAWALSQIDLSEHTAVVVVDADSEVAPDFGTALAREPSLREKAVQAYCDVRNPQDTPITRMSAVFAGARYEFAYPLKQAAGINVPLMGNGMCFGAGVLEAHGWQAFSICEDWEMYVLLTTAGVRIDGSRDARLFAEEARSLKQSGSQRKRWAAGKMTVLGRLGIPMIRSPHASWRQKLDLLAELTHLGPAAHLGLTIPLVVGTALLRLPGAWWLAAALLLSVGRVSLYTCLALAREPEPLRSLRAFLYLPFYAIWRVGVQIKALAMLGDAPWVKTERND